MNRSVSRTPSAAVPADIFLLGCISLLVACLVLSDSARAAGSYIPDSDSVVLEVLPRSLVTQRNNLEQLRQTLANEPGNAEVATRLAQRYIDIGSQGADPRFYGYARAVLAPWWQIADAPPAILLQRAKLHEKNHRFDDAESDLKQLLQRHPEHSQAIIELANLYRVQGRYDLAMQTCIAITDPYSLNVCRIPVFAVTGRAEDAYALLAQLKSSARQQPAALQWILTLQATIAAALGHDRLAAQHFLYAKQNIPDDAYLLRAYTDFLIDQGRAQEVLPLLRPLIADNGILLRAAIAARHSGQAALAQQWQAELGKRFAEIRLRGDLPHGRFESRYALELLDDPQRALALAQVNWDRQKEPRDSRNLLQAAAAAGRPQAGAAVHAFLARHGTQDIALQKMLR